MAIEHLEASVRHAHGATILDLSGEINGFAAEALDVAYSEAEAENSEVILLNFKDIDYINSTGIALIVGLLSRARASKRRLFAYNLSDHFVEIFNITRLSDFIRIYPDERSAMAKALVS